ncbi:MAG: YCF48-related protein [Bryobacteraceae bacterium]
MFRISALALLLALALAAQSPHWQRQYFYDDNEDDLTINDLQFSSAQRGIAVGFLANRDNSGKPKPVVLVTSDGGAHWTMTRTKEAGLSLFLLDDSVGWMVAEKGIWQTVEAGRSWTRLSKLKDVNQVYFLDRNHGFAAGSKKSVCETKDGGKSWTQVAAAKKPEANPDYTSYTTIDFADAKSGIIAGGSSPPRHDSALPDWVDPSHKERRREWPTLSILLETRNAGETWSASTAPLLGRCALLHLAPDGWGLSLFEFEHAFEWPSAVYAINLRTGKSVESFHAKNRVVTDVALFRGKQAFLAAIEPPGKTPNLPIPGRVKILRTGDLKNWQDMDVDYRAVATRVILAPVDPTHVWAATDTGMILKLVQ